MQQPAGVVEKGLCSLCTKIVWNNQERFQTPEGGYVHNACHLAYKGTCKVCSKTVFDFDERWRTPEGTYVHKACVPNAESVQLSRGIAANDAPVAALAGRAADANEADELCTCLLLKLRGSGFPVKDSGIEGNLADPFFEIRSNYQIGEPHLGEHDAAPDYKSKKVRQDLNPQFRSIAIDLKKLCGMDLKDRRILVDIFDWDRFSAPDFMSFMEVTVAQLIDLKAKGHGLPLRPPPAPHKQEVGELWVDRAELAYPQVHIGALERNVVSKVLHKVAKAKGDIPERGPDISITNQVRCVTIIPCLSTCCS